MSDDNDRVMVMCDACEKEEEVREPQEAPPGWYYATIQIREEEDENGERERADIDEEDVEEVRIFACSKKCRDGIWTQEPPVKRGRA